MMRADPVTALATFGTVWAALAVGHNLADHVLGQTDRQAARKGAPDAEAIANGANRRAGWGACLRHVALYHLVLAVLVAIAWLALPLQLTWLGLLAGFAWSAVTHAFLDRRWPVRWLLEHTGSGPFSRLASGGMNGMYLADQALHGTALFFSALLITRL
jgi:hypothetical protein